MKTEPFQFPGIFLEYFQSQPLISKQVIYGWLIVLVWLSIALMSRMKSLSWIVVLQIQLWKAQVMSHLPLSKDIHSLQLKFLNPVPLFRDSETVIFFLRLIHAKTLLWTLVLIKIRKSSIFFSQHYFKHCKFLTEVCSHDRCNASQSTSEISSTLLLFLSV